MATQTLPITLHQGEGGAWHAAWDDFGGFGLFGDCVQEEINVLYVGVPPVDVPTDQHAAAAKELRRLGCVPVWVDRATFQQHFAGFCKGTLWPAFHNIVDIYSPSHLEDEVRARPCRISRARPSAEVTCLARTSRPAEPAS